MRRDSIERRKSSLSENLSNSKNLYYTLYLIKLRDTTEQRLAEYWLSLSYDNFFPLIVHIGAGRGGKGRGGGWGLRNSGFTTIVALGHILWSPVKGLSETCPFQGEGLTYSSACDSLYFVKRNSEHFWFLFEKLVMCWWLMSMIFIKVQNCLKA